MRDTAESRSQIAALGLTAALAMTLLLRPPQPERLHQGASTISIELSQPAPPAPPAPPLAKPHPLPAPAHARTPSPPRRVAPSPAPSPAPPMEVAAAPSLPAAVTAVQAAAPAAASAPALPDLSAENRYVGLLHSYVQSITSPPQSADYRLLKPSGIVLMAFTLTRAGALAGLRLLHSSGSSILDEQAQRIIGGGRYPAFPDEVYRGQASHEFSTPIRFQPADGTAP